MDNPKSQTVPPRLRPLSPLGWLLFIATVAFVLGSLRATDFSPERLARGLKRLGEIAQEAFPPRWDRWEPLVRQTVLTMQIASLGTLAGVVISLGIGHGACRHVAAAPVSACLRGLVGAIRTIPELIWGLVFVALFGLGPFAGVLAVCADTVGFCGRFFTEAFDDVTDKELEGIQATGASSWGMFLAGILPTCGANVVHTSLYALERSVRASIVLGLVGAGGIGVELDVAMRLFRYDEAFAILLAILVLVLTIERISEAIRHRLRGGFRLAQ